MKYPRFLLALACAAASFTCLSSPDGPDPDRDPPYVDPVARWDGGDTDPEGETVVVEGDAPGTGWDADWWFPGPGHEGTVQPPGGAGGGGGPGGGAMDPEPDRNKDRKSCFDWCDWSKRQCVKWCHSHYPYPHWDQYNQCIKDRCDNHSDPDLGYKSCRNDCQRRFPERPITATWDAL